MAACPHCGSTLVAGMTTYSSAVCLSADQTKQLTLAGQLAAAQAAVTSSTALASSLTGQATAATAPATAASGQVTALSAQLAAVTANVNSDAVAMAAIRAP